MLADARQRFGNIEAPSLQDIVLKQYDVSSGAECDKSEFLQLTFHYAGTEYRDNLFARDNLLEV